VVDKKKIDTYVILLSAPLLLTIYRYHGEASHFGSYFKGLQASGLFEFYKYLFQFSSFFFLMFIFPVLFIKLRLKRSLVDFGLGPGDINFGFKIIITMIPFLVVPLIFLASKMPDVRSEYPLLKLLHRRHDLIIWYEAAYAIFYYLAWEFYFRGFLLFSLKEEFGAANAVMIQTISSCLVHIGKPEGEIIGSIFVGILFGFLVLRARSIWYVVGIHASIGILTDIFIIFD